MSTITAKDLTKDYPRSPFDEVEGLPWLARLIDKVRALQAGKIGEYTPYPCGGDQRFLGLFGIDAAALKAKIDSGASDAEIGAWAKANAKSNVGEVAAQYRAGMGQPAEGELVGYLQGAIEELKQQRPDLDFSDVKGFPQLICVEEGHKFPG